jgi:hypothetical protein
MSQAIDTILQYVLTPDNLGQHLRQMAEQMAKDMRRDDAAAYQPEDRFVLLRRAAHVLARFIHLGWGPVGPEEYAPRMLEMLLARQVRMRGMNPESTWEYAISSMNGDIRIRLQRAAAFTLDPQTETALIHSFFDGLEAHHYLHDVVQHIQQFHWQRRHDPQACLQQPVRSAVGAGPRGEAVMERHLRRTAIEGLATYIEQSNIVRGHIEEPTDSTIVLRDRLHIQHMLGAKNARTWEASGRQLADQIESHFGTSQGRREARRARGVWKDLLRRRTT